MKKTKWVKKRHRFFFALVRPFMLLILVIIFRFRYRKLDYDHQKQYIILSNHQTDVDAGMIWTSLGKYSYPLATDTIFSHGFLTRLLNFCFAFIPIRKGMSDPIACKRVLQVAKEGGSVLVFPEGNRTYAEFQYPLEMALVKLIRKCHLPLMIMNLHGGTGVSPRFGHRLRKGQITCSIKTILSVEEMENMPDQDLLEKICQDLKVYDSDSHMLFTSHQKAEYLERMLFYCPVCHSTQTLHSQGDDLFCSCGLKVRFNEDLTLSSAHPDFSFSHLFEWYEAQKSYLRQFPLAEGKPIFQDERVKLYLSHPYHKRKLISKGRMSITSKTLTIGSFTAPVTDVEMASPISGTKLALTLKGEAYLLVGSSRFNPLKYALLFHRLDTPMKKKDIYYRIDGKGN